MGGSAKARMEPLLNEAEESGVYFVPEREADRTAARRRVKSGELAEPLAGAYARTSSIENLKPPARALRAMQTLAKTHPSWTFCNASAALAHGLPVTWRYLNKAHVATSPRSRRRTTHGIEHHWIKDCQRTLVDGLWVTSLIRTTFDCLATFDEADGLAIADAALRTGKGTAAGLVEQLRARYRGHRGVRKAVEVARIADGRAESGGESIARWVMYERGFPLPELQVWIPDPVEPGKWFRVDFLWMLDDGSIVIGEFDGRAKSTDEGLTEGRTTANVLQDERLRESHLTAYGFPIVRMNWDDVSCELGRKGLDARLSVYGIPKDDNEVCPSTYPTVRAELAFQDSWTILATEVLGPAALKRMGWDQCWNDGTTLGDVASYGS